MCIGLVVVLVFVLFVCGLLLVLVVDVWLFLVVVFPMLEVVFVGFVFVVVVVGVEGWSLFCSLVVLFLCIVV